MGFEDLDYTAIHNVLDNWEVLRRTPDYARTAGTLLFSHLFEKCPSSKAMFGFPIDMDPNCDTLKKSKRFAVHAVFMIEMLDRSLGLLGPDAELLTEIMAELGKKHAMMGIEDASYYTSMGEALFLTMSELTGKHFTPEVEESWTFVYGQLADAMTSEIGSPEK